MTSRRGTLVEEGARELLQIHGYTVRIVPPGFSRRHPPAHLIATRQSGETRLIRIRKLSHRPSTAESIATDCAHDIDQFRKFLSRNTHEKMLHCEIWVYSLTHGFRCFEILADTIVEIPKLPLDGPAATRTGDAV